MNYWKTRFISEATETAHITLCVDISRAIELIEEVALFTLTTQLHDGLVVCEVVL